MLTENIDVTKTILRAYEAAQIAGMFRVLGYKFMDTEAKKRIELGFVFRFCFGFSRN